MSTPATRQDIDELLDIIKEFMGHSNGHSAKIDDRFTSFSSQFVNINNRLDKIESEIIDLKNSHDQLTNTLNGFFARPRP